VEIFIFMKKNIYFHEKNLPMMISKKLILSFYQTFQPLITP